MRIDEFPTHELNGIHYRIGHPLPFGATIVSEGVINFSVNSASAKSCSLVLYRLGEKDPYAVIPFPEHFHLGDNYSMMVFGLNPEDTEYGYRFDGEYVPERGLFFDKNRTLLLHQKNAYIQRYTGC